MQRFPNCFSRSLRVRREAMPSRLFILDALPRTDRGKLNRDVVRNACLSAANGQEI